MTFMKNISKIQFRLFASISMKNLVDPIKDVSQEIAPSLQQKINHNGLTNSPPLTQIIPPVLIILSLLMTLITIIIQLDSIVAKVCLTLFMLVNLGCIVFLWYRTTSIIPTCSIQLAHLKAMESGEQFDHTGIAVHCKVCKTYINTNCHHCSRCRRCVQFMDHHCRWLNNCIGAKNYFEFYGLIISTFILLSLCVSLSSYCLSLDRPEKETDIVLVCSVLTILISSVPCCWLIYLIILHTYLIITKKTTIQLIMESRKKNKITPKDQNKNHIFKVSYSKNEADNSVALKKVAFPSKEEEMENSSNDTHHQLIRNQRQERMLTTEPSLEISYKTGPSFLPPLKNNKLNFSFSDNKASHLSKKKMLNLIPPLRRRSQH